MDNSRPAHLDLTDAALARYRATAQRRRVVRSQQQYQRQQQGQQIAQQAAALLKREFGATRVRLFGSLLDSKRVHPASDIDLAVDGLPDQHYLTAVARLLDLSDFSVDLVQMEHTRPRLKAIIESQGIDL
ncbi:MAG: nucleotidyltransferase domain-containing protein [Cyanobacteria bacterium P01_A01_bin.114]